MLPHESVPCAVIQIDGVSREEICLSMSGTDQKANAAISVTGCWYHLDVAQADSLFELAVNGCKFLDRRFLESVTAKLGTKQPFDIGERGSRLIPVAQILVRDSAQFANVLMLLRQSGAVEEDVSRVLHKQISMGGHTAIWMLRKRLPEIRVYLLHSRLLSLRRKQAVPAFSVGMPSSIAPMSASPSTSGTVPSAARCGIGIRTIGGAVTSPRHGSPRLPLPSIETIGSRSVQALRGGHSGSGPGMARSGMRSPSPAPGMRNHSASRPLRRLQSITASCAPIHAAMTLPLLQWRIGLHLPVWEVPARRQLASAPVAALSMSLRRLPAGERLVRLRQGRVHYLLVHAGVGGQLDDVAVRVAKIDRPAEAVVDRSAHFHAAFPPFVEHALEHVVVDGQCYVQVEAVLLLEFERLVRRL